MLEGGLMVRTAHGILNNSPTEVEQRRTIFGKPLGPVVRRFGLLGWTAIELARALRVLGVDFDMDELCREVVIGKGGVVVQGAWLSDLECEALERALQGDKKRGWCNQRATGSS
jgi:hypothetical protein